VASPVAEKIDCGAMIEDPGEKHICADVLEPESIF